MIDVLLLNFINLLFGVLIVALLVHGTHSWYLCLWGIAGLWLCCWINLRVFKRVVAAESLRLQRIEQSKAARTR